MALPNRLPKKAKRDTRCCEHCSAPLVRKDYEEGRDFSRRRFCDKTCSARFKSPYASRSEKLLGNSDPADERGCWNWIGHKDLKGYGRTTDESGEVLAHRLSFMEFVGPIPEGLHILHSCDNPACINPGHLRAGTNDDNMADRIERDRCWKPKGEANPKAKLTTRDVLAIRNSAKSRAELAAEYGVAPTSISHIILRRTWAHV
jgi:hypothetical protein